jgi:transcriptional regulator with XRE-family HTH domain
MTKRSKQDNAQEAAEKLKAQVAKNIKLFRKRAGLTQVQLGELAGVTGRYVAELEKKSGQNLTVETLARLADILNVTVIDLFSGEKSTVKSRKESVKLAIETLELYYKSLDGK